MYLNVSQVEEFLGNSTELAGTGLQHAMADVVQSGSFSLIDRDTNLDGFQLGRQPGQQRVVRGKEEGWLCLLMTVGVTLGTSLLKNKSAVRASNF